MHCFLVYPDDMLQQLKKHVHFKQVLSNAIDEVLVKDLDVRNLIGNRKVIDALRQDKGLRRLLIDKTKPVFDELVSNSRSWV